MGYSAEEVADRMAIHDLIATYVHAIDDGRYDDLDQVFLPETLFDLTSAGSVLAHWPEVKEIYRGNSKVFVKYFHLYGNMQIKFDETRSTATMQSKVINPIGVNDEEGRLRLFQVQGVYDDVLRKTDDGWRITNRVWLQGWISGDYPFAGGPAEIGNTR